MPPRRASFTCMPPAAPVSCIAASACMETPVAPIGCPLALRPPDGLTGRRPALRDRAAALSCRNQAHGLVFDQLRNGEAVVGLDEREIGEREAGAVERAA